MTDQSVNNVDANGEQSRQIGEPRALQAKPRAKPAHPKPAAAGAAKAAAPSAAPRRARLGARAKRSAERRAAILAAALDEFAARGFAATRLDDVAQRAGVAKGTIYLHFADKETLFQELIRAELSPVVGALVNASHADMPLRQVTGQLIEVFVREIFETRRKDVIRLVLTEGPRFPKLAEFYYREVISRGDARRSARMLRRAFERGELKSDALVRFPQLLPAPGIVAIVWSGLFDAIRAARRARHDARAFRRAARPGRRGMNASRIAVLGLALLALAACSKKAGPRLSGLGRGRPDLRQPRRGRPGRHAVGARGRDRRDRRAAVRGRSGIAAGRRRHGQGHGDQRHAGLRSRPGAAQDRRPARRRRWRMPRRRCAPRRRGSTRRRPGWRAARWQAR